MGNGRNGTRADHQDHTGHQRGGSLPGAVDLDQQDAKPAEVGSEPRARPEASVQGTGEPLGTVDDICDRLREQSREFIRLVKDNASYPILLDALCRTTRRDGSPRQPAEMKIEGTLTGFEVTLLLHEEGYRLSVLVDELNTVWDRVELSLRGEGGSLRPFKTWKKLAPAAKDASK